MKVSGYQRRRRILFEMFCSHSIRIAIWLQKIGFVGTLKYMMKNATKTTGKAYCNSYERFLIPLSSLFARIPYMGWKRTTRQITSKTMLRAPLTFHRLEHRQDSSQQLYAGHSCGSVFHKWNYRCMTCQSYRFVSENIAKINDFDVF